MPISSSLKAIETVAEELAPIPASASAISVSIGAQDRLGGPRLGGDHHGVACDHGTVIQRYRPCAVLQALQRRHSDAGAHLVSACGVGHRLGQLVHALGERREERLGVLGVRRILLAHLLDHLSLGEERRDHVAVLLLHLEQVGERGSERHVRRVRAMHATDERLGKAVEDLSAHAPRDEALERLVVELAGLDLLLGHEEVHAGAQLAGPGEQPGGRERHELGGREHHHAVGHLVELAARQDQRLLARLVGGHGVAGDADLRRDPLDRGLGGQEGVRPTVDDPGAVLVLADLAVDLAAETVVALDEHEVDVLARRRRALDLQRRAETRDSPADDDDLLHVDPSFRSFSGPGRVPPSSRCQ